MSYTIRITGLDEIRARLGQNFMSALDPAIQATALQLEQLIKPYPPPTIANSPSNPTRHWYERGYGSRWVTKRGEIRGKNTSQKLGIRWVVGKLAPLQWAIKNIASYAEYVHSSEKQARWHTARGWLTEKHGFEQLIRSGALERIFRMAFARLLRG